LGDSILITIHIIVIILTVFIHIAFLSNIHPREGATHVQGFSSLL